MGAQSPLNPSSLLGRPCDFGEVAGSFPVRPRSPEKVASPAGTRVASAGCAHVAQGEQIEESRGHSKLLSLPTDLFFCFGVVFYFVLGKHFFLLSRFTAFYKNAP